MITVATKALLLSIICWTAHAAVDSDSSSVDETRQVPIISDALRKAYDVVSEQRDTQEISEKDIIDAMIGMQFRGIKPQWARWAFEYVGSGKEIRNLLEARNEIIRTRGITKEQKLRINTTVGTLLDEGLKDNFKSVNVANSLKEALCEGTVTEDRAGDVVEQAMQKAKKKYITDYPSLSGDSLFDVVDQYSHKLKFKFGRLDTFWTDRMKPDVELKVCDPAQPAIQYMHEDVPMLIRIIDFERNAEPGVSHSSNAQKYDDFSYEVHGQFYMKVDNQWKSAGEQKLFFWIKKHAKKTEKANEHVMDSGLWRYYKGMKERMAKKSESSTSRKGGAKKLLDAELMR